MFLCQQSHSMGKGEGVQGIHKRKGENGRGTDSKIWELSVNGCEEQSKVYFWNFYFKFSRHQQGGVQETVLCHGEVQGRRQGWRYELGCHQCGDNIYMHSKDKDHITGNRWKKTKSLYFNIHKQSNC